MENQKTMTEQQTQELLDILKDMPPKTDEERAAEKAQRKKDHDEMMNAFFNQHDFLEAPTLQARQAGAWTRKNILLDTWNQWLNYETRMAEHFGDYPKDKGFRHLNNTRRCDMALNFAHYFLGAMEAQVKFIDEEAKKSKEV